MQTWGQEHVPANKGPVQGSKAAAFETDLTPRSARETLGSIFIHISRPPPPPNCLFFVILDALISARRTFWIVAKCRDRLAVDVGGALVPTLPPTWPQLGGPAPSNAPMAMVTVYDPTLLQGRTRMTTAKKKKKKKVRDIMSNVQISDLPNGRQAGGRSLSP